MQGVARELQGIMITFMKSVFIFGAIIQSSWP